MKLKSNTTFIFIATAILICIYFCGNHTKSNVETSMVPINIKMYKTIMPQAEGSEAFETYCISCHSLRYIQMQPDLPAKKWQGIVDKMIKTFGAPIPDSTETQIVAYLVKIKGLK